MKRLLVALILLAMCVAPQLVWAATDLTGCEWLPGRLMVDFKAETGTLYDKEVRTGTVSLGIPSVDELLARYGVFRVTRVVSDEILSVLKTPPDLFRWVILECPEQTDVVAMMEEFQRNAYVGDAYPDVLKYPAEVEPNDTYWNVQFDKRVMNTPIAWEFSQGNPNFVMAAVDVGTWWRHEDLYDNLWVNPGEDLDNNSLAYADTSYPGDPGDIDDADEDGDGYVDDFLGWDFIRNLSDCMPGEDCDSQMDNDPTSLENHGTHVAGLMGAVGNNAMGVAGQMWHCKLISNRTGYVNRQGEGRFPSSLWATASLWAVGKGAKIINLSLGGTFSSSAEQSALTACWNNGAIVVAASGNEGIVSRHYPGAYNNVVCVGSTDADDVVSDFSNRGTWVDCFAPGRDVMSLNLGNGYVQLMGTSMASPNAAGMFGLIWSIFPEYTNAQIVNLVLNHAVDISALNPTIEPESLGYGRLDASLVLAAMFPRFSVQSTSVSGDNDGDGRIEGGESGNLFVTLLNDPNWAVAENISVAVTSNTPGLTINNGSFTIPSLASGATFTNSAPIQVTAGPTADPYWATITVALSGAMGYSQTKTFQLRVGRAQTLLVADDDGASYRNYFASGLLDGNGQGYSYDVWDVATAGAPTWDTVHEYGIVIWVCGNETANTITASDQALLTQFLNGGGKLIVAGQNIDEDIRSTSFYSDYLHAQTGQSNGSRNLVGVSGDAISDGTSLLLIGAGCAGNGNLSPSVIVPVNGGTTFFTYTGGTNAAAVRYENATYKTAYFAFAIEAACGAQGTTHYSEILRRTMQWFGATPTVDVDPSRPVAVPEGFELQGNFPNPFNPSTTIVYNLSRDAVVTLDVFDMLGRKIANLTDGRVSAGTHAVSFDGYDLPSGAYFARLKADGFTATHRMMLVK